jgi:hypothetical protein
LSSNAGIKLNSFKLAISELALIQAESIGWISLDEGAFLHLAFDESSETNVIEVIALPKADMQGLRKLCKSHRRA